MAWDHELEESPEGEDKHSAATGRIAFAKIESRTLGGDRPDLLEAALVAGSRVHHYQRDWILGRVTRGPGFVSARLGFEAQTQASRFDEKRGDFVTAEREDGTYSPFVIDLERMRVAFQIRPGAIRAESFTSALQALLNQNSETERWRVERERSEITWSDWLTDVARIERVKVRVERPNPHYHGRDKVEEILEGLNAQVAELSARAEQQDPQGLDASDDLLEQLVGHADRYGSVEATGEDANGERVRFATGRRADELEVEVDPATGDVSESALRDRLSE